MSNREVRTVEILAELLMALGRGQIAKRELAKIGRGLPDDFEVRDALRVLREEGDPERAIDAFFRRGKVVPASEFYAAAVAALERGDVTNARKLFAAAKSPQALPQEGLKAATKILTEGDYQTAFELCDAVGVERAFPPAALIAAAKVCLEGGGLEEARTLAEIAAVGEEIGL